jgi:hypothetical protein
MKIVLDSYAHLNEIRKEFAVAEIMGLDPGAGYARVFPGETEIIFEVRQPEQSSLQEIDNA